MKNPVVENGLRWMLAAWTLLATTFASPTFVHGHFEGDRPHGHERSDLDSPRLFYPPVAGNEQGASGDGMSLSGADLHQHRCLLLLGAVEYSPMPSEPAGSHEKSPSGWETIIVASPAQGIRAHSGGLGVDHFGVALVANLSVGCICLSGHREIPSASVAPGSLLCDRARHERSGVQLA